MNAIRPDVVTFGETMAVLRAQVSGPLQHNDVLRLSCAGAESTVAIGLSRLGHHAIWVGRTGDDEPGAMVRATLRGTGVDLRAHIDPDRPTGLLLGTKRTATLNRVRYYRRGSAGSALTADDLADDLAQHPRIVHATGITPALSGSARAATEDALRRARAAGALISYDVNHRPQLHSIEDAAGNLRTVLPLIDVLFCGEDELAVPAAALDIPDATVHDVMDKADIPELVVKRGRSGAIARVGDAQISVPAVPVTAVDVVGAGDAFVAGYLSAHLDGLPLADRLRRATLLGAFNVTTHGDWEGLPTRAELALLTAPADFTDR